jgi:hypothetical protein
MLRTERASARFHAGRFLAACALGLAGTWTGSGCDEDLTSLGSDSRTPPDTLQSLEFSVTLTDTVFPVPVSLGKSPVDQIGRQIAYTPQILYAFGAPTFVVEEGDTLRLDAARVVVRVDSLGREPFNGSMRIRLREVAESGRDWHPDSILTRLPDLLPATIAPDAVLDGSSFVDGDSSLTFLLDLNALSGYAAARASGDSLLLNVALTFVGFDVGGPGFLEIPATINNTAAAQLIGDSNLDPSGAIFSVGPERRLTVVEYDSTFSYGTNFVTSDGYRQHTYVKFVAPDSVLPDSALVYMAELIVTQVEAADGDVFSEGPQLGIIVPSDTTAIFSVEQNTRPLSFTATLAPLPGTTVVLNVTPYIFDQQEGKVSNRGMILRLSNEGTKVRHYEFYGARDPDPARRPRIRVIYGLPSDLGGE